MPNIRSSPLFLPPLPVSFPLPRLPLPRLPFPLPSPSVSPRHGATPTASTSKAKSKRVRNLSPTVQNRQARFRYEILSTYECGIELLGTEIKSVRHGAISLRDGYARVQSGQLYLHNVHISPWTFATNYFNHDPLRPRRLLLHKSTIRKLAAKQKDTGLTLIPTRTYFSRNGYLKVEIALARGKKLHDRREQIKQREDNREISRIIKNTLSS